MHGLLIKISRYLKQRVQHFFHSIQFAYLPFQILFFPIWQVESDLNNYLLSSQTQGKLLRNLPTNKMQVKYAHKCLFVFCIPYRTDNTSRLIPLDDWEVVMLKGYCILHTAIVQQPALFPQERHHKQSNHWSPVDEVLEQMVCHVFYQSRTQKWIFCGLALSCLGRPASRRYQHSTLYFCFHLCRQKTRWVVTLQLPSLQPWFSLDVDSNSHTFPRNENE